MATVKEARRAVERGDVDEALVLLWNALEPLRLAGDTAGLQRVAALADEIAVLGDGEHAHEAALLHAASAPLIGDDAAVGPAVLRRPVPVRTSLSPLHRSRRS